jgi:hypothetical protein
MSSLVTSASPWTNGNTTPKKRQSTLRNSTNMRPNMQSMGEPQEYISQSENYQNLQPETIDDIQASNQDRNTRVNELLNKITSADSSEDANKMGNFKPISHPAINIKKDMTDNATPQVYTPPMPSFANASNANKMAMGSLVGGGQYAAMDSRGGDYSNYQRSYEPPAKLTKPYYAAMGLGSGSGQVDNKLLEKINYMIHLLEQQQSEKTNNITEEFVLYTFLGVFIIFVLDSFARSGKYVR